jgi:beta-glucosidase
VDAAVEALLAQWTVEDKVNLVSGKLAVADDGTIPALPPGLPLLALADGPAGLRLANPTLPDHRATALPAPVALAATWDPALARHYGDVLGAEAAATGHTIFLGPAVDIARAPWGGRTFESFGEDPLLQSRLVAPEIEAIQAHGVIACVKHYLANNQEHRRSTIDVVVDERTLQEVYLPPFAAAIQAGAGAVMGSYNRINGVYACENPLVLTEILRGQLGFRGFVMSDFLANPSTAASAEAGLDWELGAKMWGPALLEAVKSGVVAAATLDEMVRRILRPVLGLGLAERPGLRHTIPLERHRATAQAVAEQAIVLLKNEDHLLPLPPAALGALAVVGPDADNTSAAGGGSGLVLGTAAVSVLDGIRTRLGESVRVEYAPGVDPIGPGALLPGLPAIPAACFAPAAGDPPGSGLLVEYWDNAGRAGEPVAARTEGRVELNLGFYNLFPGLNAASPKLPARPEGLQGKIGVRWRGVLAPPASGEYELSLTYLGTARLLLDGQVLIDANTPAVTIEPPRLPVGLPPAEASAPAHAAIRVASIKKHLTAGEPHAVTVEYAADAPGHWIFGEAMLRLGWRPPAEAANPAIAAAAALAARCDAAVVVVRTFETEEMDRPDLRLPNEQDALIRAVAAANPRTTVVLMNAGPVEVHSWEQDVGAIVEAWYAGQEQGSAVARVLFGDVNPGGKLPLTFPRTETATPLARPHGYGGVDGVVHYAEGIGVGYRGYQREGITPQYPFGHGLSYTTFAYENLDVKTSGGDTPAAVQVEFDLQNTGQCAGTEVAQVYVAGTDGIKRLAGWQRLTLQAGERRRISVTLARPSQAPPTDVYDAPASGWNSTAGERHFYVGASSEDVQLLGQFR